MLLEFNSWEEMQSELPNLPFPSLESIDSRLGAISAPRAEMIQPEDGLPLWQVQLTVASKCWHPLRKQLPKQLLGAGWSSCTPVGSGANTTIVLTCPAGKSELASELLAETTPTTAHETAEQAKENTMTTNATAAAPTTTTPANLEAMLASLTQSVTTLAASHQALVGQVTTMAPAIAQATSGAVSAGNRAEEAHKLASSAKADVAAQAVTVTKVAADLAALTAKVQAMPAVAPTGAAATATTSSSEEWTAWEIAGAAVGGLIFVGGVWYVVNRITGQATPA